MQEESHVQSARVCFIPIHVRLQLQVLLLQQPILLDLLVQLLLLLAATPLVVLPLLLLLHKDKIPAGGTQVLNFFSFYYLEITVFM